jgi:phosphomannomutase
MASARCASTTWRPGASGGADLGIAFDGDGDRVLMVDDGGRPVDGDDLLYVLACDWRDSAAWPVPWSAR